MSENDINDLLNHPCTRALVLEQPELLNEVCMFKMETIEQDAGTLPPYSEARSAL